MNSELQSHGLLIDAAAGPGILHGITGVIAGARGAISGRASIIENNAAGARIYFEVTTPHWERDAGGTARVADRAPASIR